MGTFVIIEMRATDLTWEVEASTVEEARRAFVECGEGTLLDEQPHDENGIVKIIDPCGEEVERVVPLAEQIVRNIHEVLDGTEWQAGFLDFIAGEVERFPGLKVRNRLVACDICDQDEVEENAEQYVLPIDLRGPDDEYLAEAGDHLNVCPGCRASIEDEALRQHRGL